MTHVPLGLLKSLPESWIGKKGSVGGDPLNVVYHLILNSDPLTLRRNLSAHAYVILSLTTDNNSIIKISF